MTHIERYYVDSVSTSDLYGKAIDGMLDELHDPHSVFLRADRLARLNESTTGQLRRRRHPDRRARRLGHRRVAAARARPAERAGIETGDRIVEVGGKSTKGWTMEERARALRGAPGTTVQLVIERAGIARAPVTLVRQEIHRSAVGRSRPAVGRRRLRRPRRLQRLDREGAARADRLAAQGRHALARARPARQSRRAARRRASGVSDLFLDRGQEIVSMRGRVREANHEFVDGDAQRWPDLPLVVLVDEDSASARPRSSPARCRTTTARCVVGSTSYGKGSAQTRVPDHGRQRAQAHDGALVHAVGPLDLQAGTRREDDEDEATPTESRYAAAPSARGSRRTPGAPCTAAAASRPTSWPATPPWCRPSWRCRTRSARRCRSSATRSPTTR